MKKHSRLMAVLLVVAMLLPGMAQAATPVAETGVEITRLGGVDRVGTSVLASQEAYKSADAVVLAGFGGDVDALTGTLLAGAKDAPLLITRKATLSPEVKTEIERLKAKTVYILGGETVVSKEVETALKGYTVKRIAGDNREETAVAVAKEVKGAAATHVFLTLGRMPVETDALADALAIGPVSAMKDMPVLLTGTKAIPAATVKAMKDMGVTDVTIVGGTSAVSEAVATELAKEYTVNRVSGDSRENTAIAIAKTYFAEPTNLIVAFGRNSADALVGGYLGALKNAPILLTNKAGLTTETEAYMGANTLDTFVLGGPSVITETVYDQIVAVLGGETGEEVVIESVSAINAKTIEVKFNKSVDTTDAKVELLRGAFKQNATVKWAEDGKSVTLTVAGKLQAGEYTVNITGVTEEALTRTVKVEAQKVETIEVLDDVAVMAKDGNSATVSYVVKDQYGVDITKETTLKTNNVTDIVANKDKGIVEIKGTTLTNKKVGDKVVVVLIDDKTGVTATKTVELSDASAIESITVTGIYNKDGKELNEDSTEDFYLVLDLKDQYEKEVLDAAIAKKLLVTVTDEKVITAKNTDIKVMKIDGKDKVVLPIATVEGAGTTKVLLISSTTGNTGSFDVTVAETKRTDAVQLSQPETAVEGDKEVLVPLMVQDKEGNVVTDLKVLKNDTKGIKIAGKQPTNNLVVKDGKTFVKLTGLTEGYETVVVTTSTNKVATVTFEVKAKAKATVVRGLEEALIIKKGVTETIKLEDLVVEDQYGRVMKGLTNEYTVVVKSEDKDIVEVKTPSVKGLKNGTATLTISLAEVENSAVEVKVTVTDGKEYTGYEIAPLGKVQVDTNKKFTVNGLLNNGKIALGTKEYTAVVIGGQKGGTVTAANNELKVEKDSLNKVNGEKVDTEFTLTVTINATGKVLEQKFTVSPDDIKVQDFFFTTAATTTVDHKDAKAITEVVVNGNNYTVESQVNVDNGNKTLNVATVDQYNNKEVVEINPGSVVIVPENITKVNITDNGKVEAKATLVADVDEAKLTVTVKIGNATKELKVTLKRDTAAEAKQKAIVKAEQDLVAAKVAAESDATVVAAIAETKVVKDAKAKEAGVEYTQDQKDLDIAAAEAAALADETVVAAIEEVQAVKDAKAKEVGVEYTQDQKDLDIAAAEAAALADETVVAAIEEVQAVKDAKAKEVGEEYTQDQKDLDIAAAEAAALADETVVAAIEEVQAVKDAKAKEVGVEYTQDQKDLDIAAAEAAALADETVVAAIEEVQAVKDAKAKEVGEEYTQDQKDLDIAAAEAAALADETVVAAIEEVQAVKDAQSILDHLLK